MKFERIKNFELLISPEISHIYKEPDFDFQVNKNIHAFVSFNVHVHNDPRSGKRKPEKKLIIKLVTYKSALQAFVLLVYCSVPRKCNSYFRLK